MDLDKIFTSRKVALLLTFLAFFLAGGCVDEPESTSDAPVNPKGLAEFIISRSGGPILLPVTYREKEYLFLLDTGSSHTAFDTSFKQELGEVKTVKKGLTSGSPILAEFFNAPEAFLGPLNLKESGEIACLDLHIFNSVLGKKVSGIIGMKFLRKYVVQIDFDKGTLSFLQPREEQHTNWGIELAMEYDSHGWPQITGFVLDDIEVDFVIDTGANSTGGLDSEIFKNTLSEKELKTSEILFATASGVIRKREMRIKSLSVGSLNYADLIFGEANMSHLGLSFLSRHIVTFDFPNSRMYLTKSKGFKKVDETDMSGLHLLRISKQTVVYSVDEDSPAQKAGIRANDIILNVGDKDANTYDILELRRFLMTGDKRNISMTIKHGDEVKDLSFLLKKKI
jgi:predicted aspartyl protease